MAKAIRRSGVRRVPLSEIKDDLSRFLHEAEDEEIVISRSGKPAGVLTLYSTETGVFDRDEMRLLDDLAGDIGLAMAYIDKEEKLNFLAYYDALTGLCNRSVLVQRLRQEITYAHRRGRPFMGASYRAPLSYSRPRR